MSISREQRRKIRLLAGNCCEYCRIAQTGRLLLFQVDHMIAVKHGGTDADDNLCLACSECNLYKGSNVAGIDPVTGQPVRLYDPRQQEWNDHFDIQPQAMRFGRTPEGRVTILVLRLNDELRVRQRFGELRAGDYPCHGA